MSDTKYSYPFFMFGMSVGRLDITWFGHGFAVDVWLLGSHRLNRFVHTAELAR